MGDVTALSEIDGRELLVGPKFGEVVGPLDKQWIEICH